MKYRLASRSCPRAKEYPGKALTGELLSRTGGPVQDHDSVGDVPIAIGYGLAICRVVQLHFRQLFTRPEAKIVDDEISFSRLW